MTPNSIRTGRQLDASVTPLTTADDTILAIAPGDANRVAVGVALQTEAVNLLGTWGVEIGPKVGAVVVPLTTLTVGHPVCWLSVDKVGPLLMQPLYAFQQSTANIRIGVTIVRQVQELP